MSAGKETRDNPRSESTRIRVFCVDDHPALRKGIATIINSEPDMFVIAEASNGPEAIDLFRLHQPDVTLMDLRLPGMGGVDATIAIRAEFPEARIIMLTTFEGDVEIRRSLEAGVRAYMLKTTPSEDMVKIIRQVQAGKKCMPPGIAALLAEHYVDEALTNREIEVLRKIASGKRNQDIAESLNISEQTVKAHITHILEKLGASGRAEAVAIATRRGIIQL